MTSPALIMTTDLVPKVAYAEVMLRRGRFASPGMTKGSGMIAAGAWLPRRVRPHGCASFAGPAARASDAVE